MKRQGFKVCLAFGVSIIGLCVVMLGQVLYDQDPRPIGELKMLKQYFPVQTVRSPVPSQDTTPQISVTVGADHPIYVPKSNISESTVQNRSITEDIRIRMNNMCWRKECSIRAG